MLKGIWTAIVNSLNSNDVAEGLNTGQISAEDAKYAEIRAAYLPTALDPPF
jgi:hypothetical protein